MATIRPEKGTPIRVRLTTASCAGTPSGAARAQSADADARTARTPTRWRLARSVRVYSMAAHRVDSDSPGWPAAGRPRRGHPCFSGAWGAVRAVVAAGGEKALPGRAAATA